VSRDYEKSQGDLEKGRRRQRLMNPGRRRKTGKTFGGSREEFGIEFDEGRGRGSRVEGMNPFMRGPSLA